MRARKRFGQNFLHDPMVIEGIVAAIAPRSGEALVEIGPGLGALTRPLYAAAGSLDVVEIDRDLAARLREEYGAKPADFLVGGVGRLVQSKGFDTLIRAFLEASPPGAHLVVVGDGSQKAKLQALAGGRVTFTGFRRNAKDYYPCFDLFVCPSRSEPMGRVILEALDAGTPVLATAAQGPSEILAKYPGTLVPIDDVPAMADALRRLVAARPPRQRPDLSPHEVGNVAREILAAYEELVAARRSARLR